MAVPGFLLVGVLWGALYAIWGEALFPSDWPDWLRGLVYSALPLAASLLVAMPLLGIGFLGIGATGAVAATGELLRHAAYGVLLDCCTRSFARAGPSEYCRIRRPRWRPRPRLMRRPERLAPDLQCSFDLES